MTKPVLTPIRMTGGSRTGTLQTTLERIRLLVGEPNVTDMDDEEKVKAAWGFQDDQGRRAFIWAYKQNPATCTCWSIDGDKGLLVEIFGVGQVI